MRKPLHYALGGLTAAALAFTGPVMAQGAQAQQPAAQQGQQQQPAAQQGQQGQQGQQQRGQQGQQAQRGQQGQQGQQQGLQTPQLEQPQGTQLGQQQQFGAQMQEGQRSTYSMGTVQGTVQALDFDQGLIRLRSSGGTVTLRARPMEMANLNPGDVVALEYANYNGALWIQAQDTGNVSDFAQFGTLTGNVTQVNKGLGTITVRGRTFRAHPEQLEQVIPGQFVSLGYANISGTNWVAGIDSAYGSGGGGGGGGGGSIP